MKNRIDLSWDAVIDRLQTRVDGYYKNSIVYGIPKGGMIAASFLLNNAVTYDPSQADIILDDLVDSGKTRDWALSNFPKAKFIALFDKQQELGLHNVWLSFPWERDVPFAVESVEENVTRQLQYLGEDITRDGLADTPSRVVRSWKELYAGYSIDPKDLFTIFDAEKYDEIVLLKNIEMYSMCEHHMLPFHGKAHIAYIADGSVIGISKLARLLEAFSRRLQIQERIGMQVTDALNRYLKPLGAACIIESSHMCMTCRGVQKQHSVMVTSSLTGRFKEDASARNELMSLIKD